VLFGRSGYPHSEMSEIPLELSFSPLLENVVLGGRQDLPNLDIMQPKPGPTPPFLDHIIGQLG